MRPLSRPWPYILKSGEAVTQSIRLTLTGTAPKGGKSSAGKGIEVKIGATSREALPPVGLGVPAEEIDHAISEIKKAAIDDGKNINDHVHVDANRPWAGRLHDAHDLLSKAHHDVAQEENNPTTRGLRDRVLSHIDKASYFVDRALGDEKH